MSILLLCSVKQRLTEIATPTLGTLGNVLSLVVPNDWYVYCCFGEGRLFANWRKQRTQAARPQELVAFTIVAQSIWGYPPLSLDRPVQTMRGGMWSRSMLQTSDRWWVRAPRDWRSWRNGLISEVERAISHDMWGWLWMSAVEDFQAWCKQDGRLERWLFDERLGCQLRLDWSEFILCCRTLGQSQWLSLILESFCVMQGPQNTANS